MADIQVSVNDAEILMKDIVAFVDNKLVSENYGSRK
jgi:hypothetical protein